MTSSTLLAVDEQWIKVANFYNDVSPKHRQEPMKALITAISEVGVKNIIWPTHSHFVLVVSADNLACIDRNSKASIHAEYWHEVDKFQLRYHNIQSILYDEKWCEMV